MGGDFMGGENSRRRGLVDPDFALAYNPKNVRYCRRMRRAMTPAESRLWHEYLKFYPFRVLRQRPIDHYIVDFYCARLKLVIEVDGARHFTRDGRAYDATRTAVLRSYGLQVVRFSNDEVLYRWESVCRRLTALAPPPE